MACETSEDAFIVAFRSAAFALQTAYTLVLVTKPWVLHK